MHSTSPPLSAHRKHRTLSLPACAWPPPARLPPWPLPVPDGPTHDLNKCQRLSLFYLVPALFTHHLVFAPEFFFPCQRFTPGRACVVATVGPWPLPPFPRLHTLACTRKKATPCTQGGSSNARACVRRPSAAAAQRPPRPVSFAPSNDRCCFFPHPKGCHRLSLSQHFCLPACLSSFANALPQHFLPTPPNPLVAPHGCAAPRLPPNRHPPPALVVAAPF